MNAAFQLAKQNFDLEILALLWGITQGLLILSVISLISVIIECAISKPNKPQWITALFKLNPAFKWMVDALYWSAMILLIVGFTA